MKKCLAKNLLLASLASALLVGDFAFADDTSNSKTKNVKKVLVFKSWDDTKNFTPEEKEVLKIIKPAVEAEILELGDSAPKSGVDILFASYNLDQNGRREVFVYYDSSIYCGTAGCATELYQLQNKEWKIVSSFHSINDIAILSNKTNNLNDFSTPLKFTKEDSDSSTWGDFTFKWNGEYYTSKKTNSKK